MFKQGVERLQQASQPLIMGILNLTPDSFSDGGRFNAPEQALSRVESMLQSGADIIDIGAESTRPGSQPVDDATQMARMISVVEAIHHAFPDCLMSIDTTSAVVGRAAIQAGAGMLNDISAGRFDPDMFRLAAETGVPLALMHMQGTPQTMQDDPRYEDVCREVREFLQQRCEAAMAAGMRHEQLVVDPGIGFGKLREHNLQLLARLDSFAGMPYPVLLGTSRKRFMGAICHQTDPLKLGPATLATTVAGVLAGVRIFRVHDVADNRQAADVAAALLSAAV